MLCETCGKYVYKGEKLNASKEDVKGYDYLDICIYRFYVTRAAACKRSSIQRIQIRRLRQVTLKI